MLEVFVILKASYGCNSLFELLYGIVSSFFLFVNYLYLYLQVLWMSSRKYEPSVLWLLLPLQKLPLPMVSSLLTLC